MSILFSPLLLKSVKLRNRIMMSPMCQYMATDGFANDWHFVHYGSRAVGGAGLILQEATAISPEGRITPYDLGIWSDEHIERLRHLTSFIRAQGAVPGIQLAHAGRKASMSPEWQGSKFLAPHEGGWQTVAPSALAYSPHTGIPHALTREEIHSLIHQFAHAAKRAYAAGYKVIEIHAAHGYLLHEFLSPLTNQREDEYGGSFGRRLRLLEEIIEAIQQVWPEELPIFVRISATDWQAQGNSIDDSVKLAKALKDQGISLIDVSTGGLVPHASIPIGFGYQLPFATRIKRESHISTGAVGMITNAIQAETILRNEDADLIVIGRELLRDPYFPLQAAHVLEEKFPWPLPYRRAKI